MRKIPFSKLIVALSILIATGFILWCCAEMHRLNNLEPIAYIGTSIVGLLATVVAAYMWRAKQSDLYELEISKTKQIAELRQTFPNADEPDIEELDDDCEN